MDELVRHCLAKGIEVTVVSEGLASDLLPRERSAHIPVRAETGIAARNEVRLAGGTNDFGTGG